MTDCNYWIRQANLRDLTDLIRLEKEFPSDRISQHSWRYLLQHAHALCLVAENNNGMLGDMVLLYRSNSRKARLYSIVVNPCTRGIGLGKGLIQAGEEYALVYGRNLISLEVRVDNYPAINLYHQLGYKNIGYLPNYYHDQTAAYRMSKSLLHL